MPASPGKRICAIGTKQAVLSQSRVTKRGFCAVMAFKVPMHYPSNAVWHSTVGTALDSKCSCTHCWLSCDLPCINQNISFDSILTEMISQICPRLSRHSVREVLQHLYVLETQRFCVCDQLKFNQVSGILFQPLQRTCCLLTTGHLC